MESEVMEMNFIVLYKDKTSRSSNYFKLLVEYANGIWEEVTYFGNTTPKQITSLKAYKDSWIAEIQKHTSRDRDSGRFKGKRTTSNK